MEKKKKKIRKTTKEHNKNICVAYIPSYNLKCAEATAQLSENTSLLPDLAKSRDRWFLLGFDAAAWYYPTVGSSTGCNE